MKLFIALSDYQEFELAEYFDVLARLPGCLMNYFLAAYEE